MKDLNGSDRGPRASGRRAWRGRVAALGVALASSVLLSACGVGGSSTAELVSQGNANPIDPASSDLPATSRETKRLTVDMLAASLPVVSGNDLDGAPITWTVTVNGTTQVALSDDALAPTLGKADYVDVTEENTDPSTLYLKFVDDMARDVCAKMIDADYARSSAADRALLRLVEPDTLTDAASIEANLRYLKLRFLGQKVADDDVEGVADLEALFNQVADLDTSASDSDRAKSGWMAVCVALFSAPAFHIY